jgi:hypothetical protein
MISSTVALSIDSDKLIHVHEEQTRTLRNDDEEKMAEQTATCRKNDKEKITKRRKTYRAANGGKTAKRHAAYYKANREIMIAQTKASKRRLSMLHD